MKSISGEVVSSKPISLSKAASILSNFVSTDNGASHALRAYLRRASSSFADLVQLHKDLKHSSNQSERRHSENQFTEVGHELSGGTGEDEAKKHKKKNRKLKLQSGDVGQNEGHKAQDILRLKIDEVEDNGGRVGEIEIGGGMDTVDGGTDGLEGVPSKKKKRKKSDKEIEGSEDVQGKKKKVKTEGKS